MEIPLSTVMLTQKAPAHFMQAHSDYAAAQIHRATGTNAPILISKNLACVALTTNCIMFPHLYVFLISYLKEFFIYYIYKKIKRLPNHN